MPVDASMLTIVHYPHPTLRQKAKPVASVDADVRAVAARMIELMHLAEGIGLAAPQVGLPWRLFVVHIPDDPAENRSHAADPPSATGKPMVFINPTLREPDGPLTPMEEGCLSLPEIRGGVLRQEIITVDALDTHGNPFTHRAAGLLARCLQHEHDHLDGILIIDKMNQLARIKNRARLRDLERSA